MTLRADPWIEQVLHVECPYCGHCHTLESDSRVWLPDDDFDYLCDGCEKRFVVSGAKKRGDE